MAKSRKPIDPVADLQARYDAAQVASSQAMQRNNSGYGGNGQDASMAAMNNLNNLSTQLAQAKQQAAQAASAAKSQAAAQAAAQRAQANRDELFTASRAREQQLRQDPVDMAIQQELAARQGPYTPDTVSRFRSDPDIAAALAQLRTGASGQGGPFDATTRNSMFSQASDNAAAAEAGANDRITQQWLSRGGNMNDPALQAALSRNQADRSASNQASRMGIDLNAGRANYDAQQSSINRLAQLAQSQNATEGDMLAQNFAGRGQALGQGAALNASRNNAITDASRNTGNLLAAEQFTDRAAGPVTGAVRAPLASSSMTTAIPGAPRPAPTAPTAFLSAPPIQTAGRGSDYSLKPNNPAPVGTAPLRGSQNGVPIVRPVARPTNRPNLTLPSFDQYKAGRQPPNTYRRTQE